MDGGRMGSRVWDPIARGANLATRYRYAYAR